MFWKCICVGLGVLLHWQTYAAALLFMSFTLASKHLSDAMNLSSGKTSARTRSIARLVREFGQVVGITIFVSIMCPVMLGLSMHGALSLSCSDMQCCRDSAQSFATILLIGVVLSRIPILGSPSIFTFIVGAITLVFTMERLYGQATIPALRSIHLWPGMSFMVALLLVGTALTWLGTMLAVAPSVIMRGRAERIGKLLAYPFAASFGFIPLFIYCAWLGHQMGTF